MTELPDFHLALNLINNIVVFNENDEEVFSGEEIKRILNSSGFTTGAILDKCQKKDKLKEKLAIVRKERKVQQFKFTGLTAKFFLLPLGYEGSNSVILSLEDELLELERVQHALIERVKEIECLYNIGHTLQSSESFDEALEICTIKLEEGFQYPRQTFVNFKIGNKFYGVTSPLEKEKSIFLKEDIHVNSKKRGEIYISLPKDKDFMDEEKTLLKEVSLKISRAIEKDSKKRAIENARKILISKNKNLVELTKTINANSEKLSTFFKAISDQIFVIDKDFNIIMSNKDEIGDSGKCYKKVFNYDNVCDNCPAVETFSDSKDGFHEHQIGDQFLTLRSYPIFDENNEVDQVLEVCRDVTMQKQIESQLIQSYKLASLGKLVAGVAHEINNPNTFILGNLKIIEEAFNDILPILDKQYEGNGDFKIARLNYEIFRDNIPILIKDMVNGANRTNKIVADLRNFARKEDSSLSDDVDINFIVENNLTLTQKHIKKLARIDFRLAKNIPIFKGSIQKLEQVLLNLIINASQAFDKGSGTIIIETLFIKNENNVQIKVKDNGKGMDEKTLSKIFDPFYTTKRNRGGTGLGLSISYGIIKEHNGTISVESKVNEGTTFTIKIPINKEAK